MPRPPGVEIRAAEVAEAEQVARLQLDCWDDAYTGLVPQEVLDDGRRTLDARIEKWRELLTGGAEVLVAEAGDGLAGFANFGPPRDDDAAVDLELYAIYVRAAWWGTGLGHALFEQAVGERAAYLWVVEGNQRAIGFYERQGFRLDGRTKDEPEGLHLRMVRT
jgi:GNAT superfamily N-acetyltransferase